MSLPMSQVCLYYPEEVVAEVTKKAWASAGGQSRINGEQSMKGLENALQQLQPVVPLPRENWYNQAFQNFDSDKDGYISFEAFGQIIKQYHDHHAARNARKYNQHLQKMAETRPDGRLSPSANTSSTLASDENSARSVRKDHSGWEFVSDIVYPKHRDTDARQVYRDYDICSDSLGEGSFGKVSLATHRKTGQRRVCKTIDITCPAQWELIKQEIELMKSLNHPNILRLHETYHGGYSINLILELCEGGPLYQRIVNQKSITEEQVAEWMRQILSATAFCHDMNIVHRDIKPENILFVNSSDDSSLKVIDFGLSSTLAKIRKTQREILEKRKGIAGALSRILPKIQGKSLVSYHVKRIKMQCAGTPHYMAPEMIRGVYDEKCDMFSVGVILYQLLSGKHPFFVPGEDNQETVKQKILESHPPTDADEWKAVSSEAIHLVKWMLQKDPRKRCSAREALAHVWFRLMSKPRSGFSSQLTPSVFEGLSSWQTENKLKQAVLHLLARELSEGEIKDLRRKFEALDRRGDGTITLDVLRYSVRQARYSILDSDLERIFKSLDTSGANRIHYTEFISALLTKRMKFEEAQLRNVFNKFDVSGEGRISIDSLRLALKGTRYGQLTDADIEGIFKEIDKNKDGYVDFYEFMDLMVN